MIKILVGKHKKVALFDDDFKIPIGFTLSFNSNGYLRFLKSTGEINKSGNYIYETKYAHRYITGCDKNKRIIFIDGDKANLQKENLLVVEQGVTTRTKGPTRGRYKGVYFCKNRLKWVAQITHNYKTHTLGSFNHEEHAASAYNQAAIRFHGPNAYVNILPED